jgi:outer membrane lipase/esterase
MPRTWLVGALLLGACAFFPSAFAADKAPFERIVVFGTSLSDPGNAFALLGTNNTPPDWSVDMFLIPDRPYAKGGHHLSNGATWIEQFARPLGLASSVRPALRGGGTNYAFSGARAQDTAGPYDLPEQVTAFLSDFGGSVSAGALYVVEIGGNDLRDALVAGLSGGPPAAQAVIQAALESVSDNLVQLYIAGARDFLIWNAPDIGLTPAINGNPLAAGFANQLAQGFNAGLDSLLSQLALALPGIRFNRLDVYAKLNTIVANPPLFGLSNVTAACITPNQPPFACKKADEYLFWDGIHPTKTAHGILAEEAARTLLP